jgi:Ni,Fe-hydrogenase I large subunit
MAVTHYLEALDFQKEIMRVRTIFGGKDIHPNWLVGGFPAPSIWTATWRRARRSTWPVWTM